MNAREKYAEIKIQYCFDNWSDFEHDTFVYKLGEMLQNYENDLQNKIKNIEEKHKEYGIIYNITIKELEKANKNYDFIIKSIHNNTNYH